MKELKPMFFTTLKNYSREQFIKDIVSGIIVAIIALPLSIALALASGVGPEQGLYTAIIAGFLISFLGGSTVQIAGPTAAFATIVTGIIDRCGMDGLAIATILAGIILILMGVFRIGTDQIHSFHHRHRLHLGDRRGHRNRSAEGLLWRQLPGRNADH